ncbi:MAG: hypothetical protein ABSF26_02270 [Thermoguttaceae bacterium]|jgi:hypothetical protein
MAREWADLIDKQVRFHNQLEAEEILRLRALSMRQRGELLESACAAAAEFCRSRLAAGLREPQPDPWPDSTWEFLKEHAVRVRTRPTP